MPPATENTTANWKLLDSVLILLIVLAAFYIGWKAPFGNPKQVTWLWLANIFLLTAFTLLIGHAITGLWRGALIDERNKISLARFQALLWTILILPSLLTAAILNIHRGQPDALAITLPGDLWWLMGISATSLVGSPLIKTTKKDETTNEEAKDKTVNLLQKQGVDPNKVAAEGQILVNTDPKNARLSDLFKGDEVGNAAELDLSKLQMFYFTLLIVAAYAVALGSMFNPPAILSRRSVGFLILTQA